MICTSGPAYGFAELDGAVGDVGPGVALGSGDDREEGIGGRCVLPRQSVLDRVRLGRIVSRRFVDRPLVVIRAGESDVDVGVAQAEGRRRGG